ncbi:hypothetical protein BDQ17DRAFT_535776 [Cyathus striatus]|nr:hypothetical protein BDQ17DRAFT_535776 [Cyathus striatus]
MKRCLCFLFLFSFLSSASALGINVPSQAAVNQPTRVTWSLDPGDETTWDFRFVLDGWDVGLAAANVVAGGMSEGQIDVTFDRIGYAMLLFFILNADCTATQGLCDSCCCWVRLS